MGETIKMKTFYLAHNFYDRKRFRKWELRIEAKYSINLDNPFYDNDRNDIRALDKFKDRSKEQKEYFKKRNTTEMIQKIVEGDLDMIRKSDGIITVLDSPSFGTPMEIFFAARVLKIPVYIITKKFAYHPWIRKFATRIFRTRIEFESFIKKEFGLRHGL